MTTTSGSARPGAAGEGTADPTTTPVPPAAPALALVTSDDHEPLPQPVPLTPSQRYFNRHLSWLEFNARVLAQAEDESVPVLERAKFLAIFSSNLDEFYQVRVGNLREQIAAGRSTPSPDGMTAQEQMHAIHERVTALVARQVRAFNSGLLPALESAGIRFSPYESLDEDDREYLDREFDEHIFPVLTPLAVDPAHPFPYISNLSLNLAVIVGEPDSDDVRIARVKVPPVLSRFVVLPDGERFVPVEQVIAAHLGRLFPGMRIVEHRPFRVTRNADYTLDEDDAEDLLEAVVEVLRRRRRAPRVVRLEVERDMPPEVRELLLRELELDSTGVYTVDGPLDLTGLWALHRLDRPELHDSPWTPVTQPRLAAAGREGGPAIFDVLSQGDVLVHHPYDSFTTSVEAFIEAAADDPDVLAIKQTLYRTSGPDSPIVRALIHAAEAGKQVVTLVELTARFDEAANIAWAERLEEVGVHVVYGMVGLKTHAKISLVVRREGRGIRRYCHVGTGNYNEQTARLYEDIGLLTADPELGADLSDLFNYLTGYSRQRSFRELLVAPRTLRQGVLELIRRQTRRGAEGRILIKVNHLVDAELCDALYEASAAGVDIDLIVRSSCGIRPGVPGLSENIRVRSLLGRFLEHSRIFRFGRDGGTDWYVGSADLMARNLDGRVEALVPVKHPALQRRLAEILDIELADDRLAWELAGDGLWRKIKGTNGSNSHQRLQELAIHRAAAPGPDGLGPAALSRGTLPPHKA